MKAFLPRALVFVFPCVAVAQIAILQIKVLEGEGAVHPGGAHVSKPLTVEVTDDLGHPVAGAAVSFQLPPEGPSGLFANGLRTDLVITDAAGHATIHAIQLNRISGQLRIRITAVKEQARAGIVSFQSIGESQATKAAPAPAPAAPAPVASPGLAPLAASRGEGPQSASPLPSRPSAERSAEITPTTVKMGRHISKKWIVLGAVAVVGGAAALGLSHAASSSKSGVSGSTASIGTPTVTIGNPNP